MQKKIMLLVLCGTLSAPLLGSSEAYRPANTSSKNSYIIKDIYFNFGTHTEFYNAIQTDDKGGLRKFDWAPTLGIGLTMPMANQFSVIPEFNWVLPQTMEESHIMINTFMFRTDLAYDLIDWIRLRLGTGIMWANQQGRGGKTKMRNGNDHSTFYYPEENRSTINNTLDLGVETKFDEFALRLQTYIYSVFKEEQRQVSYTLFFTYYWDRTK